MENCSLFLILTNFINENTLKIFIQSTATILSVLLSGFIASVGAAYYTKILKEVNKSIETANYAKLLAYECAANAKNYKIIAESIKNVNKDITYIIGNNLGERWSKILEYDFNKDENHQICYAMLSVLSENDIKFWNQNKEKFIHLPPYYFELMHKYFTQTRPSCQIVYSISNLTQADYYVTYSNKCAIYSDIINLYLSYLIEEAFRPYLGYIFKSRFVNKYLKPLNKKLYETNELKTPLFFNSKNK